MEFYFFDRLPTAKNPGGVTVSKRASLPDGDFRITEFLWGDVVLWFVATDKFNADERQTAYKVYQFGANHALPNMRTHDG